MIITSKKSLQEIIDSLEGLKSVYLFGCDTCAEQCKTGGQEELDALEGELTEAGFDVMGSSLIDETCYRQIVRKEYRQKKEIAEADAVLVLACGAGVKSLTDTCDESQPVIPALNSLYLAKVERIGQFFEGCSLCGECVLAFTGGICPHTECPKGLLNGPCGGVADSMCEVDTDKECAWVQIYSKLKAQGRLSLMERVSSPKDRSRNTSPKRTFIEREVKQLGKKTQACCADVKKNAWDTKKSAK